MVADGSTAISAVEASRALYTVRGIGEGSFTIVPFYPENFLVHCHSMEVRELLLASL